MELDIDARQTKWDKINIDVRVDSVRRPWGVRFHDPSAHYLYPSLYPDSITMTGHGKQGRGPGLAQQAEPEAARQSRSIAWWLHVGHDS